MSYGCDVKFTHYNSVGTQIHKGRTFEMILVIFFSVRERAIFYKSCDPIEQAQLSHPARSQLRAGGIRFGLSRFAEPL